MEKKYVSMNRDMIIYYEVEFVDMDHSIEWLIETASAYQCIEAIQYLNQARAIIGQRKLFLFGQDVSH